MIQKYRYHFIFVCVLAVSVYAVYMFAIKTQNKESPGRRVEQAAHRGSGEASPHKGREVLVLRVIDGDTIEVKDGDEKVKVRLLGIDTPEIHSRDKKEECLGNEAALYTRSLLSEKTIILEYDKDVERRDIYGRLLAYVLLDGENINKRLIVLGYASEYTYKREHYTYQKDFKDAEIHAQESSLGMWGEGACDGANPSTR